MPRSHLDHITVVAPTLSAGVEFVHTALGVMPEVGGEHPRMGTHNCFLKLGEKVYLEIIAVNPSAPPPQRSRWFELDQVKAGQPPRLATWVARTDDIDAATSASPVPLGDVEPMDRGQVNWLMSIPRDGSLPLQGIAPTLIQWPPGTHPTFTLKSAGCVLVRLDGYHPDPAKIQSVLEAIGFEGAFHVSSVLKGEQPYLVAYIQTSLGPRYLRIPGLSAQPRS